MLYLNAKEFSNPETVILKIGMSPLVSTKFITFLTNSYKEQNRKHEILLMEENQSILDEKLKNHELDLIILLIVKNLLEKIPSGCMTKISSS